MLPAPKVAFMFLVRGELPLAPLWERFFHGHTALFSVYVHPDPTYLSSPEKGSVFYGRRVPSKVSYLATYTHLQATLSCYTSSCRVLSFIR